VKGAFTGVADGPSFFKVFCNATGTAGVTAAMDATESVAATEDVVPEYPTPVVITNDSIVSGYYLDGAGYEDVAVLSLLAFEAEPYVEFQQAQQIFFANAVRDGKTNLVIDLSANGGGYILQGYDSFRQLFPNIIQDGYTRWRESDTFLTISEVSSSDVANISLASAP
jgi:C-terminal processing protease CtpA/Prc